jgi:hypothetical protein
VCFDPDGCGHVVDVFVVLVVLECHGSLSLSVSHLLHLSPILIALSLMYVHTCFLKSVYSIHMNLVRVASTMC